MRSALLIIAILFSPNGFCQVPQLISNITAGNSNSTFGEYIVYNHQLLFSVYPGQLWISDGSATGTQLVKAFPNYIEPKSFAICNGKAYFVAADTQHGKELWVTDGTAPGTQMVKDIYPGAFSSMYGNIVTMNNKLYFVADDSVHGSELWVSDGTAAGTQMVKDVNPASGISGAADNVAAISGKVIFAGNDGSLGEEPWVSDGTAAGTHMLADLDGTLGDTSSINSFSVFGNKVYFSERMSISLNHPPQVRFCVTDGSAAGTIILNNNLENSTDITQVNGKVYFNGTTYNVNFVGHAAIWMSDGTGAGTQMLKDSMVGRGFTQMNNKLYFGSVGKQGTGLYANELWQSDGTNAGTAVLKDFSAPSMVNSCKLPGAFKATGNTLFLKAWDSATARINLWFSNGTAGGTHYIDYPNATAANYNLCSEIPSLIAVVDTSIFFAMEYDTANTGFELYKVSAKLLGVQEPSGDNASLKIYPNPSSDNVTIECTLTGEELLSIELTDVMGKTVRQLNPADNKSNNARLLCPLQGLPSGIYLVQLRTSKRAMCQKLVIQ